MIREFIGRFFVKELPSSGPSRQKWVTIAISFVAAVTLWFLVTLNTQTYSTQIPYPVQLVNLPDQYQLTREFPKFITVTTQGLGIKLMGARFNKLRDTISVDFQRFSSQSYFLAHENPKILNEVLPEGLNAVSAYPDSISLTYVMRSSKKVPLQLRAKIEPAESYRFSTPITFSPDSIEVFGPTTQLDTLKFWPTVFYESKKLNTKTTLEVPLDTMKPFQVFLKSAIVQANPEKFTQNSRTLRITPVNLPPGTRLRLMPDTIHVTYLVPVANYGKYEDSDFRFLVDYEKIKPYQTHVFPEPSTVPYKIEVVKIDPPKVGFMIEAEKPR